jgi:uncharacterized membrane protein YczE
MRSFVDTLATNPWRWLPIVGIAGAAAVLVGTWSATVIMLMVVTVAVSTAARGAR